MVAAEFPADASLAEVLSNRARRTPRDRLLVDLVGGLLIAGTAIWARPAGWLVLAAAAACLALYGLWAIAEVRLLPRPWPETTPHAAWWRAVQKIAAVLGVSCFLLLLFAGLGVALGRQIS